LSTTNATAQNECCLIGCHNSVTNRLRFSLRCHKNEDFKQEFLDNGWNKVCHYHYFSDLYKYKKMTHGTAKNGNNGGTTGRKTNKNASPASPVADVAGTTTTTTLGKRGRKAFEQQAPTVGKTTSPADSDHQRLEDANVFVHFLMTTTSKQGQ